MKGDGGVFDVLGRPAVMVHHRHPLNGLQQVGAFHHVGAGGVAHHAQGGGVRLDDGILFGNEHIPVLGLLPQAVDQLLGGGGLVVDDDIGGPSRLAHGSRQARAGADGIQV